MHVLPENMFEPFFASFPMSRQLLSSFVELITRMATIGFEGNVDIQDIANVTFLTS